MGNVQVSQVSRLASVPRTLVSLPGQRTCADAGGAMGEPENVVVYWPISCFDRRKDNPLQVDTRFLVLDEGKATDEEKQRILELVRSDNVNGSQMPTEVGKGVLTISHGPHGTGREILKYRHLFRECEEGLEQIMKEAEKAPGLLSLKCVSLMGEYFEDENGNEITKTKMHDYMAGAPVIIHGEPDSVTRFGPSRPKEREAWTIDTANTIGCFLQVTDLICGSRWFNSALSITSGEAEQITDSAFPSAESALGVLVLFRQLYSSNPQDDLFNRACGYYVRHVGNRGKAEFVKAEKKSFNSLLRESPPLFEKDVGCSTRDLLEAFLYGTGIMHSQVKDKTDATRLNRMLETRPPERIVMAFHLGMRYLLDHALKVYPVIKQDFVHWVNEVGLCGPDIFDIAKLLSGRSETDTG